MNYRNHFKHAIWIAALISGCGQNISEISLVQSEEYGSDKCWYDGNGDFAAFLILARADDFAVPYLVSARCLVEGTYSSYGEAIIHHLNEIRIVDSSDLLQHAFEEDVVLDNIRTDLPMPSSDSRLYSFRARLTTVPDPYRVVYSPSNIIEMTEMNLTFERFLSLSKEERENLLAEFN